MNFKNLLAEAKDIPWKSRLLALPENDYDQPVLIMFSNGHLALLDGGTVHDDENITLWKELKTQQK